MFGKRKIGIALSGGGARGLAHIGVLQVLEDLGVEIEGVSGCSMGAAVGAIYCAGVDLKEMESYVNSLDWRSFLLFSDFSLSRTGIINGRRVEDVLKSLKVNFIIASSIIFESEAEIYKGDVHKNSNSGKKINAGDVLDKSMNIIHAELVKNYLHDVQILIEPKVGDFGFLDFIKGKDIIERGRKAAIAKIPEIKKKLRLR